MLYSISLVVLPRDSLGSTTFEAVSTITCYPLPSLQASPSTHCIPAMKIRSQQLDPVLQLQFIKIIDYSDLKEQIWGNWEKLSKLLCRVALFMNMIINFCFLSIFVLGYSLCVWWCVYNIELNFLCWDWASFKYLIFS